MRKTYVYKVVRQTGSNGYILKAEPPTTGYLTINECENKLQPGALVYVMMNIYISSQGAEVFGVIEPPINKATNYPQS